MNTIIGKPPSPSEKQSVNAQTVLANLECKKNARFSYEGKDLSAAAFYVLGCLTVLALWWLASCRPDSLLYRFGLEPTSKALVALLVSPRFWQGLGETMQRLGIGLGIAAVIGLPVGLITGYFARAGQFTYVPFQFLRMISPLSWTPVAIILLGIGSGPVYFPVAVPAVLPIILNTAAGFRAAYKQWTDVARCLGAGHWQIIRFVLLRATLPSILVGIQLALGVAWIVIVPAEMLGVASGLGYMILDFRDVNDYGSIMALILVIGFLGLALDLPLRLAAKKLQLHSS